ncbi:MAG TPA: hypothetical protein VK461_11190 [Acidimicrobiales bacterium]|nr:hypothetical protein [Acidimicrobiales bacterium]
MNGSAAAAALVACIAAYGVHLVHTGLSLRWSGIGPGPRGERLVGQRRIPRVGTRELQVLGGAVAAFGGTFLVFGGVLPSLIAGAISATLMTISDRAATERRCDLVADAWPGVLEEVRVLAGAGGRPIPQALFQAGVRTSPGVREAFVAAQREWQSSTDFTRAIAVLKAELDEASSDVVCETLLVAHQVGGSGVDRRLEALAEDRVRDLDLRRDARSRQAGARFARRFVLIVPIGMAFVGLSLGTGRSAYQSRGAQITVGAALALIAACWVWAGRILRLPRPGRTFA